MRSNLHLPNVFRVNNNKTEAFIIKSRWRSTVWPIVKPWLTTTFGSSIKYILIYGAYTRKLFKLNSKLFHFWSLYVNSSSRYNIFLLTQTFGLFVSSNLSYLASCTSIALTVGSLKWSITPTLLIYHLKENERDFLLRSNSLLNCF